MDRKQLALYVLIAALAFVFGWFGIDKFLDPLVWVGFLPTWMDGLLGMPKETWLVIMGVIEIAFALMLIIPVRNVRRLGALLIVIHLLAIVWQVGWNDVAVRDIGLLLSSLSLLLLL
jgi:uncharacterized membrane protein